MAMMSAKSPWLSVRGVILIGSAGLAILGASGLLEAHAFAVPTTLKYVLTIVGPLIVLFAASIARPLYLVTGVLVVVAPFAGATAQFGGVRLSPLVPLLIVAIALIVVSDPPRGRPPTLRWSALLAFPLLLVPLAEGTRNHPVIVAIALLIAIAYVVSYAASDKDGLRVVVVAVAIQAALQGAIAIWESRTGHTLNLYSSAGATQAGSGGVYTYAKTVQPNGAFNDPISLGNALAISVPIISILILVVRSRTSRAFLLASLALSGIALGLSLDRAGWIAGAIGVAAAIALLPRASRRKALPYAALGSVVVVAAVLLLAGPAVSSRFSSIFDPTSTQGKTAQEKGSAVGEQTRLQLWSVAVADGFLRHPVAGIGIDNIAELELTHTASSGAAVRAGTAIYQNAASTYLQLAAEGGLLAIALLLLLANGLFTDARAGLKAYPVIGAGLAGAVVALLICWVTDVVVLREPVAACVGVLFGAVAAAARYGGSVGSASDMAT